MAYAVQATTHYQTYPERPPGADLPPKKVCNLDPMAPRSRSIILLPSSEREPSALVPSIMHGASASISPAAPCIFPRPVAIILGEIRSCEILVEGGHVNSATADLISVGGLSPIYSAPRAKLPAAVQT